MPASHDDIAQMKAAIKRMQAEAADLEAEIIDLERGLERFTQRYTQLIQPKIDRIEIITQMIKDLEQEIAQRNIPPYAAEPSATWSPPPDYVPVEEQFRRTWQVPLQSDAGPQSPGTPGRIGRVESSGAHRDLKQIYRKLVRRYHPDLTTDPIERRRRNRLMAEINAAYAESDLDALHALADQPDSAPIDEPLAAIEMRQLQQIHFQLSRRIAQLQQQHYELTNGEIMWHKIQASFASREGRDYLQDMAARLDAEYNAMLDHLDDLKRRY